MAGSDTDAWLTVKLAADKKQGDLSMLLKSRADPNALVAVDWREFSTSALFEAAVSGHTRIVRMLLSAGADANIRVGPGYTPLYNAAFNGHSETVRLLAESNADVNTRTEHEFSPLYIASQQGHVDCVRALLDSGATPDAARPQEGATALYIASQNGHAACVEALLNCSTVSIDLPMCDGSTPLMIACYFQHLRVIEMLLRAGASLAVRDKRGLDALEWARKRNDALVVALVQEELAARAKDDRFRSTSHDLLGFTSSSGAAGVRDTEQSSMIGALSRSFYRVLRCFQQTPGQDGIMEREVGRSIGGLHAAGQSPHSEGSCRCCFTVK